MKRYVLMTAALVMLVFLTANSLALAAYPSGYTIKGIEHVRYEEEGLEEVRIYSTKIDGYNTITLTNPNRIVIDIPSATAPSVQNITQINSSLVKAVRYAQFDEGAARIVLDVQGQPGFKIFAASECLVVYINNTGEFPDPSGTRDNSVSRGGSDRSSLSPGASFGLDYSAGGRVEQLYISADNYSGYKVSTLDKPSRIVVDIPNAKAPLKQESISVNSILTKNIRYAQNDANTARIVLDVSHDLKYSVSEQNGSIVLSLENPWYDELSYHSEGDRVYLLINSSRFTEDREALIKNYTERYEDDGRRYIITFSRDVADISAGTININDGLIDSIQVIKNSTGKVTSMIFTSQQSLKYQIMTRSSYQDTAITIINPALTSDKLVVIDPGHGGSEPGAIHQGIYEKDLNIDIALRLEELLKQNNIKTYMIREDDTDVGLYERAYIANKLGAALFLSIHNNAMTNNPGYDGTMTLCYSKSWGSGFTGYRFAQIVHESVLGKLGTTNRGIIERPNLVVLRETKMPAVIAEIAYMTNQKDLNNLKQEEFRQRSAEALCEAIIKALTEIR
jgi:N-acetylmuramoyl-L-alanine amidase